MELLEEILNELLQEFPTISLLTPERISPGRFLTSRRVSVSSSIFTFFFLQQLRQKLFRNFIQEVTRIFLQEQFFGIPLYSQKIPFSFFLEITT